MMIFLGQDCVYDLRRTYYSTSPAFFTSLVFFQIDASTFFELGLLHSTTEDTHSPWIFPEVTHNGWKSGRQRVISAGVAKSNVDD